MVLVQERTRRNYVRHIVVKQKQMSNLCIFNREVEKSISSKCQFGQKSSKFFHLNKLFLK